MNSKLLTWATHGILSGTRHLPRGRGLVLLVATLAGLGPLFAQAAQHSLPLAPELRGQAIDALRQVFDREQRWVKVHAAEYLLALDYPEGVKAAFTRELDLHGSEPEYRIGIWRVLARAANNEREQTQWIDKIHDVLNDPAAVDRTHAAETLAKLRYQASEDDVAALEQAAEHGDSELAPYAAWILANSGQSDGEDRLARLLDSPNVDLRRTAAYALRHLPSISALAHERLLAAVRHEPAKSKARAWVVAAAAVHALPDDRPRLKAELAELLGHGEQ